MRSKYRKGHCFEKTRPPREWISLSGVSAKSKIVKISLRLRRLCGEIVIHDLDGKLGHHDTVVNDEYDWPYGYYLPKLGSFIENHKVQIITFPTPRGLTLFQKESSSFEYTKLLRGY